MSTPTPLTVTPYLNFEGRCQEAVEFYQRAVQAEVECMMQFKDAPPPQDSCPSSHPNKVMHCAFKVGGTQIMASDCECKGSPSFQGISLALSVTTQAEAQRLFSALSTGGTVCMPLTPTFWSPAFGVVTDPFGVCWMINTQPQAPQPRESDCRK